MFETLISGSGSSLWAPAPRIESRPTAKRSGLALPAVQSGQLWFVELPAIELALSPLEYQVLTTVNVVIYDRALASVVAGFLPLGGYAEPAAPNEGTSDPGWERCLRFARDGWSVARLVERGGVPRQLSERLLAAILPTDWLASVFTNNGAGVYERSETPLAGIGCEQSPTVTIAFGAIDSGAGPHLSAVAANGLAG